MNNGGSFFSLVLYRVSCSSFSGQSDHVSALPVESYRRISASVVAVEAFAGSFIHCDFHSCRVVGLSISRVHHNFLLAGLCYRWPPYWKPFFFSLSIVFSWCCRSLEDESPLR